MSQEQKGSCAICGLWCGGTVVTDPGKPRVLMTRQSYLCQQDSYYTLPGHPCSHRGSLWRLVLAAVLASQDSDVHMLSKPERLVFWLMDSGVSGHVHPVLLFWGLWQTRTWWWRAKLLISGRLGTKKGGDWPQVPLQGWAPNDLSLKAALLRFCHLSVAPRTVNRAFKT